MPRIIIDFGESKTDIEKLGVMVQGAFVVAKAHGSRFPKCQIYPAQIEPGHTGKHGDMCDKTGPVPKITSREQALKEILYISKDKRSHFLLADACDWLELKMKLVGRMARAGLKRGK